MSDKKWWIYARAIGRRVAATQGKAMLAIVYVFATPLFLIVSRTDAQRVSESSMWHPWRYQADTLLHLRRQ